MHEEQPILTLCISLSPFACASATNGHQKVTNLLRYPALQRPTALLASNGRNTDYED